MPPPGSPRPHGRLCGVMKPAGGTRGAPGSARLVAAKPPGINGPGAKVGASLRGGRGVDHRRAHHAAGRAAPGARLRLRSPLPAPAVRACLFARGSPSMLARKGNMLGGGSRLQ